MTLPVVRAGWPPTWRFMVLDIDFSVVSILDNRATDKQVIFPLDAPAQATGQVASDDPEINIPFPDLDSPANLSHNSRLLIGLRREPGVGTSGDPPYKCRFAGIIMQCDDQGADAPTTRYTAYDPWQYMFNRPVRDTDTGNLPDEEGLTWFPEDGATASQIALDLLTTTAVQDGETFIDASDLDLIETTSVITAPFTIEAGATVGEAWQQLCEAGLIDIWLEPIYEPIDNPGKLAILHIYETKGVARTDAVMGWDRGGNTIASISRLVDGTRLANTVQFFVGQGGIPVPILTDTGSVSTFGVYWALQYFPNSIEDEDWIALAAYADLLIRRDGQKAITFDPTPEMTVLSLRDYNVGDYLPVWASKNLREPIAVDYDAYTADPEFPGAAGFLRVYAIPIEIDDNGVEQVRGLIASQETGFGA